jgi:hypothetical protein
MTIISFATTSETKGFERTIPIKKEVNIIYEDGDNDAVYERRRR